MKYLLSGLLVFSALASRAQAVSHRDRVYTADQISNTVSVIDPADNKLLGQIILGKPQPDILSALYKGQALVHGLGFAPDHKTLAVVSIGSNNLTFINPATNAIKGSVYVGRAPHEPTFKPNGKEVWVTVRGEDYVSVIDVATMRETRRVQVANGPGMVAFSPDGKLAFVCSSFSPELTVVDANTYKIVKHIPVVSPFSPNIFPTKDGQQIWFTHKDVGKVSVLDVKTLSIMKVLDTGPITNHVTTLETSQGKVAYVSVGGEDVVKVYSREPGFKQLATIPVGSLPHGIWSSGDASRVYVNLENGDSVVAINTATNTVLAKMKVGQAPMALVYIPNAVPAGSPETANLGTQLVERPSVVRELKPVGAGAAGGSLVLRSEGLVDLASFALRNLAPNADYDIYLSKTAQAPYSRDYPLLTVHTDAKGGVMAQTLGPVQDVKNADLGIGSKAYQRVVVAAKAAGNAPVLVSE
ncbi:YncE family protein [Hymenobacter sp. GOD-10R]|uniref:YncE family protein n=1 Tax=Hymenobacter sp. GOD-10R TaxID=3093922 RepID=UPI002D79F6E9|nr:YncE family protein [Hymenobacter sp. GOD-10R]WRQ26575.1 YncE family protein [Hymenobacter sp. GOD-10R]